MSFHKTYSMRNVDIDYALLDLNVGKADDAYLTISQGAPRASYRKGADGNTSASLSADHSVTVTLSLFPESEAAVKLQAIYDALKASERAGEPVLGAVPLVISDPSLAANILSLEAVLTNVGDLTLGQDTGTKDFEFYVEDALSNPLLGDLAADLQKAKDDLGITI